MRYTKKGPAIAAIQMVNDNNNRGLQDAMKANGFAIKQGENMIKKMAVLAKHDPNGAQRILKSVPMNRNANNYTTDPQFIDQLESTLKKWGTAKKTILV